MRSTEVLKNAESTCCNGRSESPFGESHLSAYSHSVHDRSYLATNEADQHRSISLYKPRHIYMHTDSQTILRPHSHVTFQCLPNHRNISYALFTPPTRRYSTSVYNALPRSLICAVSDRMRSSSLRTNENGNYAVRV